MATNFKHLEFLPLDEKNLIINDNPESNLQSKTCLYLGFNAVNSIERLLNINNINNNSTNEELSYLNLSYYLESFLVTLLNTNTISNITNTELSPHYLKRQKNISSNRILPNFSYCQNLTFTKFKTWAGLYGTLSYFINLREEYEEYYTPSQITYYACKSLFQYSKEVVYNSSLTKNLNNDLLVNFYETADFLLDQSNLESDKQIYNLSINVILSHPLLRQIYSELNFYEKWIPKIIQWEQTLNSPLFIIENPDTNIQKGINTLLQCLNLLREEGFEVSNIKNLSSSFIHQTYTPNISRIIQGLSTIRNQSTYIKLDTKDLQVTDVLAIEFLESVSKFRQPYDFNNACNLIQECVCPPAGYSLLLLSLSATLINRAYILSYENINNLEEFTGSPIYSRIAKLIGLAGILLLKTNNRSIQITGENLLKTFKLYIQNIDTNNLLDNYK